MPDDRHNIYLYTIHSRSTKFTFTLFESVKGYNSR